MSVIPFKKPQTKIFNGHSNRHSLQPYEKVKKISRVFSELVDDGKVRTVYLFYTDYKSKRHAMMATAPEDRGIAYTIAQTVRDLHAGKNTARY